MSGSVRGSGRNSPGLLGKSALDAVGQARERCWRYDWVLDLDIKGFFDNLVQNLLRGTVSEHDQQQYVVS